MTFVGDFGKRRQGQAVEAGRHGQLACRLVGQQPLLGLPTTT